MALSSLNKIGTLSRNPAVVQLGFVWVRNLSVLEINRNLSIISEDKKSKIVNMKLERAEEKPIVVMLSWLMAKRKNIIKYADIYMREGYDVLNVSVTPWQLLWPLKGTQVVAKDVLNFLEQNSTYSPIVLHGFSVGAYVWSESLVHMASEMERYQPLMQRIAGQVFDSAADITEIPIGLPVAVFPRNKVLQNALRKYVMYHLKAFDKVATCHYIRATQMFSTNIVKAPAVFFLSKTDPIGTVAANSRARDSWVNSGIKVTWMCFDKSPHVGHLRAHTQQYTDVMVNFLRDIKAHKSDYVTKKQMQVKQ